SPARRASDLAHLDLGAVQVPLVLRVEVQAHDVQVFLAPAQPGPAPPGEQVPGVELGQAVGFGGLDLVRAVGAGDDVDQRVALHEASLRRDGADRLDGGDAGAHQLLLELVTPSPSAGVEIGLRPARPAPEGDLVDGRVERRVDALVLHQLGDSAGVA